MENNLLSVSHTTEINLGNGETVSNVYVRVYTSLFTSGLVARMGANRFTTLMALASYMDAQGVCYPTQIQIADAIGVHKNTVNKYINDLLEFEIDGKPLVTRQKVNKGQGKIFSYYKIHPLSQLATLGNPVAVKSETLITGKGSTPNTVSTVTNSKNAIEYFQRIYRETYGVNYTVSNYGREGKLMKDKVITPYPEMAKEIIDLAVRKYDELFKNPKYPRPSISMFSWATNQIIAILEDEHKLTEVAEQSDDLEAEAELKMLEKLKKLG